MTAIQDPTVQSSTRSRVLHLFVSYAREDLQDIRPLLEGIEYLRHDPWIDKRMSGGQVWWNEILAHIRDCDVMLIAISPALLDSQAAVEERHYARKLGKPLLPVIIRPILPNLLPPDLAMLQFVDYTTPGPAAAFEFAGALSILPSPPALPNPLPEAPAAPLSYLGDLTSRVHAAALTLDEQLALVAQLRTALERSRERAAAVELLQALKQRPDLYYAAAHDIDHLMPPEVPNGSPVTNKSGCVAPPDWYPDPSGRHQLRWFDNDWTSWASDWGTVIEDPLY